MHPCPSSLCGKGVTLPGVDSPPTDLVAFYSSAPHAAANIFITSHPSFQCPFQFIEMNKRTEIRGLAGQRAYMKPLAPRLAHEMCWRNGISLPSLPKASCNSNEALLFSTSSSLSVAQTLLVSHS